MKYPHPLDQNMGVRALQLRVLIVSDRNVCMDGMPSKLGEKNFLCDRIWFIVIHSNRKAHELVESKIT